MQVFFFKKTFNQIYWLKYDYYFDFYRLLNMTFQKISKNASKLSSHLNKIDFLVSLSENTNRVGYYMLLGMPVNWPRA